MGVRGNHLHLNYKAEIHKWLPNLVEARRKNTRTTEENLKTSKLILGF